MGSSDCALRKSELQGHSILTVENEWLTVSIDISRGAHIFEIRDNKSGLDYMHKDPKGLDYDIGGWYELFPNAGNSCDYNGVFIPKHGDIQHLPWEYNVSEETPQQIIIHLSTESVVMPFRLEKTVRITKENPCLYVTEKITNLSGQRQPYLWGHHVTLGEDFVDANCRIDMPHGRIFKIPKFDAPGSRLTPEASGSLKDMPGSSGKSVNLAYFPAVSFSEMLFADLLSEHWYNVYNSEKEAGFGLSWDGETFPCLWIWQENCFNPVPPYNGTKRAMALEPQTSNVPILDQAVKAGTSGYLEAGESKETWLTAVVHHDEQEMAHISKDGTMTAAGTR